MGAVASLAVAFGVLAALIWAGNIGANQREERDDLDLFLEASSAGWAEVTSQFFMVPEVATQTIGALSKQMDTAEDRIALLAETIRRQDNLDAAYIAYPDGTFYFVGRSDDATIDGFRTRIITTEGGTRRVELAWTDQALDTVRTSLDDEDSFDPRERPWYTPVVAGAEHYWTAPYVFASSQLPGITHSSPVLDDNGELIAVVGVDIQLAEVRDFLDELSPRANGVALVVDDRGQVIAESSMDVAGLHPASEGSIALDQSPELASLVEKLSTTNDETVQERSADGLRTTIVRLAGARDEWYLAVRALDDDFLEGEAASNVFEVFAVGLTVATVVAALGLALMRYLTSLEQEAEIDELTGVYNRRAVKRKLQHLLRRPKQPLHVAIIDLDDFKRINDQYGHAAGDAVLVAVAERLGEFASTHSTNVGRLGGDEFIVFGAGNIEDWSPLNDSISEPVVAGGMELSITASIGVARTEAAAEHEIEDLFRAADHLLFDAKRRGGAGYCLAEVPR